MIRLILFRFWQVKFRVEDRICEGKSRISVEECYSTLQCLFNDKSFIKEGQLYLEYEM